MTADLQAGLRALWKQAFGDPEETLDAFFATGFSPTRCNYTLIGGRPVSALYWFDCSLDGKKLAYLYAVATAESHRGRGLARRLIEDTHSRLAAQGYAGAILVPGAPELISFYQKLGYREATTIRVLECERAEQAVSLTQIDGIRYAQLRKAYLPAGGVLQEGAAIDFLASQATFYAGDDFLLAASKADGALVCHELLGDTQAAGSILQALGLPQGRFRIPGDGRGFAMFRPLEDGCPLPCYFGLALD